MSLTDNTALCGTVPACMVPRLESLQGTSVIRPSMPGNPMGGYCASAAPACSPNKGCRHATQDAQEQDAKGRSRAHLPAVIARILHRWHSQLVLDVGPPAQVCDVMQCDARHGDACCAAPCLVADECCSC